MKQVVAVVAVAGLLVAATTTVVHADPKADVDAALQAHLQSFGRSADLLLASGGLAYIDGSEYPAKEGLNSGVGLAGNYAGSPSFTIAPGSKTIVVDASGHAAWFHAQATFKYKEVVGEAAYGWAKPRSVRIDGIAVDDGAGGSGGWKIARIAYTNTTTDKDLIEGASYKDPPLAPATGAPKHTGDEAIAKAADTWFAGGAGFVKGAATDTKSLVANGTAAGEFGTGAAAQKLAKSWDALALGATQIDAVAFGKLGFVHAVVRLPVTEAKTKKQLASPLSLYAIVIDDHGWKWQSINWSGR